MPDAVDLRTTLGAAPIARDVVRVEGPEALDFLQGQLSQDIASLDASDRLTASAPSFLLQPTGKVDAWLRVTRTAETAFLLDVDSGFGTAVFERLRRFKLRTKVELVAETWGGLAVRGPGATDFDVPLGALGLPAGWPGTGGMDLLSDAELAVAGAQLAGVDDLSALRIECGVPAMGAELTAETIPAEAGQWVIDASVSFTKGCYTGQELVARIDSRGGNVPKPIRGLVFDVSTEPDASPPEVGAGVVLDGADVGQITSVGRSSTLGTIALARLARSVPVGGEVTVGPGAIPARVRELPLR